MLSLFPTIKKMTIFLSLSFVYMLGQAQNAQPDSWKITWNKKVILETSKSNEAANVRKIKSADLNKNYTLEISYKVADVKKEKDWIRSFIFFDETENEIARRDSTGIWKITSVELKKLFGDKKMLKIYTIAIPSDPNLAARVRVRRVHLCTLELQ